MAQDQRDRRGGRRGLHLLAFGLLTLYILWLAAPYLHSVIVRDAAVTTWVAVATAPIAGDLHDGPPPPGHVVDGPLARIVNPRLDAGGPAAAEAAALKAEAAVAVAQRRLDALRQRAAVRQALRDDYLRVFTRYIDADLLRSAEMIGHLQRRLEIERQDAMRQATLAQGGNASKAALDAALGRVAERQRELAEMLRRQDLDRTRRRAIDDGVVLASDQTDPFWSFRAQEEAALALVDAERDLALAKAGLAGARTVAAAVAAAQARLTEAAITAPAGVRVWQRLGRDGETVAAGAGVVQWIDCRTLLVDAAVSDVELALLRPGAAARVVFEGEAAMRTGQVLLTRGATATLGVGDLAALAKGRGPGIGQVLVAIEAGAEDVAACPVGRTAFVTFPGLGVGDILRARLRL